jgi:hypothetical protein
MSEVSLRARLIGAWELVTSRAVNGDLVARFGRCFAE